MFSCGTAIAESTFPVEILNDSLIVTVDMGKGRTAQMLLDTGADTTTFSRSAAERLKLPVTAPSELNSMFSGVGEFEKIILGSQPVNHVPYAVLKLNNDVWDHIRGKRGAVDGSLGLDLLGRFAIGIDLRGETVTLWSEGELTPLRSQRWFDYYQVAPDVGQLGAAETLKRCDLPEGAESHISADGALDVWLPPNRSAIIAGTGYKNPVATALAPQSVALKQDSGKLFAARGELDGYPFEFDLDTGSNRLVLPQGFVSVLKPCVEMPASELNTVDTTEAARGCIYRSLKLGGFTAAYPLALASNGRSRYTRSLTLGMGVFEGCKLLIDLPGRSLSVAVVAPNADAPRRRLSDLGVFVAEGDGRKRLYVGAGSPAERIGVRNGDALVKLDGLPPAQLDNAIHVQRVDEDKPVTVTVRRFGSGETRDFVFDASLGDTWAAPAQVAGFPALPKGYMGAKRFPNGGLYVDEDHLSRIIRPGGSVLVENGRFQVAYHDTKTKSFTLDLPKDRFQIIPAQREPGAPPVVAAGKGALWIGGVGWVLGAEGSRVELDGFTVTLRSPPR